MADDTTAEKTAPAQASRLPTVDSLRSPQFVIAVMMMMLLYFIVVMVFLRAEASLINTVTSLTIGTVLGSVGGFYFGSSTSSQRKDTVPPPLPASGGTSTVTTTTTPNPEGSTINHA